MLLWPQYDHSMTKIIGKKCWKMLIIADPYHPYPHGPHALTEVTLRSVDMLEIFAPLALQQARLWKLHRFGMKHDETDKTKHCDHGPKIAHCHWCSLHVLTVSAYCQWVATSVFKVDRFRCHGAHEAHKCPVWPDTSSFPGRGMMVCQTWVLK